MMICKIISIIMPVRNEGSYIQRSLEAVLEQDYPAESMYILVADGMSTDATREIVDSLPHLANAKYQSYVFEE